jgi:hypothetical protein
MPKTKSDKTVRARFWPKQKPGPPKTNSRRFLVSAPAQTIYDDETPKKYRAHVGLNQLNQIVLIHKTPPGSDNLCVSKEKVEEIEKDIGNYSENEKIRWTGTAFVYLGRDPKTPNRICQFDYIVGPNDLPLETLQKIRERRYPVLMYTDEEWTHTWITPYLIPEKFQVV